jgi:hypothetical protein
MITNKIFKNVVFINLPIKIIKFIFYFTQKKRLICKYDRNVAQIHPELISNFKYVIVTFGVETQYCGRGRNSK